KLKIPSSSAGPRQPRRGELRLEDHRRMAEVLRPGGQRLKVGRLGDQTDRGRAERRRALPQMPPSTYCRRSSIWPSCARGSNTLSARRALRASTRRHGIWPGSRRARWASDASMLSGSPREEQMRSSEIARTEHGSQFVLVFEVGDEVVQQLNSWCNERQITA